ncbi:MAG: hypothetical protein H0W84_07830 [Bacteroidetes bacterium]|nr:hypothetical protein [Bacteroidota bacterium]
MKDLALYIKKKNENRPENIIKGIDPVAISLVKSMYTSLKDKGENLVLYEKMWVREIEKIYEDKETFNQYFLSGLGGLLKQAYTLLTNKSKSWDIRQDELLAVTEKILFIKSREHLYKSFYDEVETALFASIQLDFSKRINLTKIGNSKENIFTYKAVLLNTFIEAMENSVVSNSAVNEIVKNIGDSLIIITNKEGIIRYINPLGSELLGDKEALIKRSITNILPGIDEIQKEIEKSGSLRNRSFSFLTKENKLKILAKLNVTLIKTSPVLTEFIYVIEIRQKKKVKAHFLIEQIMQKSVPVKTIFLGLEELSKKLIDKDSIQTLKIMKKAAVQIKESTDEELKAIAFNSAKVLLKKKSNSKR